MKLKANTHGYGSMTGKGMVVKDVDTERRTVKGYFAAFDNVDSDGDMFKKGSFEKSILERGPQSSSNRKIMHLAYHDTRRPVSVIEELKSDDIGLYFEAKMGTHTDGEDALKLYQSGIIREHSVGFQYIGDKMEWVEASDVNMIKATDEGKAYLESFGGYWKLNEVKLWEGSFVAFGANSETPNLGVKSHDEIQKELKETNERMQLIIKELSTGTYSDNVFPMLEAELAFVQKSYNSLIDLKPSIKDTLKEEPIKDENSAKEFLLKSIIH